MPLTFVFVGRVDVGAELAPNLLEAGYRAAEDVPSADVVFTYTPFLELTEEVYFGSEGLITLAKPGAMLVNLSPATPALTHEISALAEVSEMQALDAPLLVRSISREHAFASKDNIGMFVGAEEGQCASIQAMLEAISAHIVYCGAPGAGQLAKVASTLQFAASAVGLIEAHALCGLAQDQSGSANTNLLRYVLGANQAPANMVDFLEAAQNHQVNSSYTVEYMLGEVICALAAADDAQLILPQAESIEYLLQLLFSIGGSDKSPAALSLLYGTEEECAKYGLDWSLAEAALEEMDDYGHECDCGHNHEHDHGHEHGHGYGHGLHGFSETDGFGFGGYSPN